MFYCINQLHFPSFPIGLVKTESDFIVRLVETDLGRGMLVVAVISVDAYSFLVSPSAGKNTRIVLVPCLHIEVHLHSCFWWCRYFEVLGCRLVQQMISQ